jgi:hypothetical protein
MTTSSEQHRVAAARPPLAAHQPAPVDVLEPLAQREEQHTRAVAWLARRDVLQIRLSDS